MSYLWLLTFSAFYSVEAFWVGIYGGEEIDIIKAPYMVSIRMDGQHWCGGSIIDRRFILTAAHCIEQNKNYSAVVGHTEIDENTVVDNTYVVDKYIRHPNFTLTTMEYDAALMRVSKPFAYSDKVNPISLAPLAYKLEDGQVLTISGWGKTESKEISQNLLTTQVPHELNEKCQKAYAEMEMKITERMLCAGKPGQDACSADSGGPLVDEHSYQVGITSFGINCGTEVPGVYARVSALRDWITETLKKMK